MKNLLKLSSALIVIIMLLESCGFKNNENFERSVQRYIGFPIERMRGSPDFYTMVELGGGSSEYQYKTSQGCHWAFIVNSDKVIVSWKYIGDKSACQLRPSWKSY